MASTLATFANDHSCQNLAKRIECILSSLTQPPTCTEDHCGLLLYSFIYKSRLERVLKKNVKIEKVPRDVNSSDSLPHYWNAVDAKSHFTRVEFEVCG